jgi:acyl-CoA hydrolase
MEVEVKVIAENPISGKQIFTNSAYLVYVAIDDSDIPTNVPPLVAETPEEQARMDAASLRQKRRLVQISK